MIGCKEKRDGECESEVKASIRGTDAYEGVCALV